MAHHHCYACIESKQKLSLHLLVLCADFRRQLDLNIPPTRHGSSLHSWQVSFDVIWFRQQWTWTVQLLLRVLSDEYYLCQYLHYSTIMSDTVKTRCVKNGKPNFVKCSEKGGEAIYGLLTCGEFFWQTLWNVKNSTDSQSVHAYIGVEQVETQHIDLLATREGYNIRYSPQSYPSD